ncbi:hypothetical protein [Paraburkholderia strydomiana]|uniref:hypothetical protein n=1 Tax=Paraburkholderia strydomiana TaxID=1245417 RepID=UPI0038BAA76D
MSDQTLMQLFFGAEEVANRQTMMERLFGALEPMDGPTMVDALFGHLAAMKVEQRTEVIDAMVKAAPPDSNVRRTLCSGLFRYEVYMLDTVGAPTIRRSSRNVAPASNPTAPNQRLTSKRYSRDGMELGAVPKRFKRG